MNTRDPKKGPDGIKLWNCVFKKIKDQESAITLCKSLMEMKLDSLDAIDEIVERWALCVKLSSGNLKEALEDFENQMDALRDHQARYMAATNQKQKTTM